MPDTAPIKVHPKDVPARFGSKVYPKEFRSVCEGRGKHALGDIFGLTQFGVNLTHLAPGAASAHRHWHENEDEFVFVVLGELTLVTDAGETILKAGECAGFPAGAENGHMLINRSGGPASYIEIGARAERDAVHYPDIDLKGNQVGGVFSFTRKDGAPYPSDAD
ncbi:MAG: cupin domain-containing protein [Alphaproteobacteria bacterium]|nr:cupin domain-containing protein [Alphaproteobacteria bacterium]